MSCGPRGAGRDRIRGTARTVENRRVGFDSTDRAYSFGVLSANIECGRNSLYLIRQIRTAQRASSRVSKDAGLRSSRRAPPLNDSINALSVGVPGREKSSCTWFAYAVTVCSRPSCFRSLPSAMIRETLVPSRGIHGSIGSAASARSTPPIAR